MVPSVNQPGAVTSGGVEVGVVWRAEGAVEVPQPFSTSGNVTIDLIAQVLEQNTKHIIRVQHVVALYSRPPLRNILQLCATSRTLVLDQQTSSVASGDTGCFTCWGAERLLPGSRCCRRSAGCAAGRCRFGCTGRGRGTGSDCRAGKRTASRHTAPHPSCHRTHPWNYNATSLGCTSRWSSGTGPHHSWTPLVFLSGFSETTVTIWSSALLFAHT